MKLLQQRCLQALIGLTVLAALQFALIPKKLYADQTLLTQKLVKNKAIITLANSRGSDFVEAVSPLKHFRDSVANSELKNSIQTVNWLYPQFCALVRKSGVSTKELHLKILSESMGSLSEMNEERFHGLLTYLDNPGGDFCNKFVVTFENRDLKQISAELSKAKLGKGISLFSVQEVYKYQAQRQNIALLASEFHRPNSTVGIISSPKLNESFAGVRLRNSAEVSNNNLDDDQNGYADDLYGLNSNENDARADKDLKRGFLTLLVATDNGKLIEYTTIDAARALFYALHRAPAYTFALTSPNDQVTAQLIRSSNLIDIKIVNDLSTLKSILTTLSQQLVPALQNR